VVIIRLRQMHRRLVISLDNDIEKIEVKKIALPDPDDDSLVPEFYRTIRITSGKDREVIELQCSAFSQEALELKEVEALDEPEREIPDLMDPLIPAPRKRVE
jgi:hypothetical protein